MTAAQATVSALDNKIEAFNVLVGKHDKLCRCYSLANLRAGGLEWLADLVPVFMPAPRLRMSVRKARGHADVVLDVCDAWGDWIDKLDAEITAMEEMEAVDV